MKMLSLDSMDMVFKLKNTGKIDKIAPIIEEDEHTELTAVTSGYETVYRIGVDKTHHLDGLLKKLQKVGLKGFAKDIEDEKEKDKIENEILEWEAR